MATIPFYNLYGNLYDQPTAVRPPAVAPGSITKPGDQPPGSTSRVRAVLVLLVPRLGRLLAARRPGLRRRRILPPGIRTGWRRTPRCRRCWPGSTRPGPPIRGSWGTRRRSCSSSTGPFPPARPQYAQFLDPTVAGIADANTQGGTSTLAQLARAYAQSHADTLDSLAARGMIRSGALGVHENNDLTVSNQAQYDALQKLLSGLGANYSTYLGQQDQLNQETATANSTAMQRLTDLINNGTITAPTTTTTTPSTTLAAPAAPSPTPNRIRPVVALRRLPLRRLRRRRCRRSPRVCKRVTRLWRRVAPTRSGLAVSSSAAAR